MLKPARQRLELLRRDLAILSHQPGRDRVTLRALESPSFPPGQGRSPLLRAEKQVELAFGALLFTLAPLASATHADADALWAAPRILRSRPRSRTAFSDASRGLHGPLASKHFSHSTYITYYYLIYSSQLIRFLHLLFLMLVM